MIETQIVEAINSRELVFFVGAGLSIGSGLPSWYELLSELSERGSFNLPPKEWVTGDTLIDAAQTYINGPGLHSLLMFLRERLDTTFISPTRAHYALAKLPCSMVFTANYDDLLERAYRDLGKHVHVVVTADDIPFMRNGLHDVNIIKLYGSLEQPSTIVLAREQYEEYFLKKSLLINLLEAELGKSHLLYLGWSLNDPHFNLVFGEALSRFRRLMRSGYAVMFDAPPEKLLELQRKNIRLVPLPTQGTRTELVANWLESLAYYSDDV